jgi:hypothetical protein
MPMFRFKSCLIGLALNNILMGASIQEDISCLKIIKLFEEQEVDKAFVCFLDLLKNQTQAQTSLPLNLPQELVTLYLKWSRDYHIDDAQKLEQACLPLIDQAEVRFLLAAIYANQGKWALFTKSFAEGYPLFFDSFLAYKIRGVLCYRLAQRSPRGKERERFTYQALDFLTQAQQLLPQDPSLYKLLITLAKETDEPEQVRQILLKLADTRVLVARSDIPVYVHEAVNLAEYACAQQIIDTAKEGYSYSRALIEAQAYLNQYRGQETCQKKTS